MRDTLSKRRAGESVWLFAYGSLIWNPVFDFEECRIATLSGWHRRFCIRLLLARGSIQRPGRMLALEPGGNTGGIAFRIREEHSEQELLLVWIREMVGGAYRPQWSPITLNDGSPANAIIFIADADSPLYESDSSPEIVAPAIAEARGALGTNTDYVLQLNQALSRRGIQDDYVSKVASLLETDPDPRR
ncbi:gamma-glutamylcyclotransferase [Achromobacter mucicolens]|uniref:gamma-glutamylcyclotransferase n=1 Tax=Achromobacter mucicolens TaxID=1389922 RepID=UPI0020C69EEC|nr:gamma-glutamylcyclotransferase [Achromobacter mucicolens]